METDRVILYAIGTAFLSFCGWLAPKIGRIVDMAPAYVESQMTLVGVLTSLQESFAILARMSANQQVPSLFRRVVLVVEDTVFDAKLVEGLLYGLVTQQHLSMMVVSTFGEACQNLSDARLVILDVNLPDSTVDKITALIDVATCPVIVYTATRGLTFPHADSVVCKEDGGEALVRAVQKALSTVNSREHQYGS